MTRSQHWWQRFGAAAVFCMLLVSFVPVTSVYADPPDNRGEQEEAQGGGAGPVDAPMPQSGMGAPAMGASPVGAWTGVQTLAPLGSVPSGAMAGGADSSISWLARKLIAGNWVIDASMAGAAGVLKFIVGAINGLLDSVGISAIGSFIPTSCASVVGSIIFCTPPLFTVDHPAMARIWPVTRALGIALLTFLVVIRLSRMVMDGQYTLVQEGKSAILAFIGAIVFILYTQQILAAMVDTLNLLNNGLLSSSASFNTTDVADLNIGVLLLQLIYGILLLLFFFKALARIAQLLVLFAVAPVAGALLMDRSTAGRFGSWLSRVIEVLLEQTGWVILFVISEAIITPFRGTGQTPEVTQLSDFFFASIVVAMAFSGGSVLAILGGGGSGGGHISRMVGSIAAFGAGAGMLGRNMGGAAAVGGRVAGGSAVATGRAANAVVGRPAVAGWNLLRGRRPSGGDPEIPLPPVPGGRSPRPRVPGGMGGDMSAMNGSANGSARNGQAPDSGATYTRGGWINRNAVRDARVERNGAGGVSRQPIIVGRSDNRPRAERSIYSRDTQPLSPAMMPASMRSVSGTPGDSASAQRQASQPRGAADYVSLDEWMQTPDLWTAPVGGKKGKAGVKATQRQYKQAEASQRASNAAPQENASPVDATRYEPPPGPMPRANGASSGSSQASGGVNGASARSQDGGDRNRFLVRTQPLNANQEESLVTIDQELGKLLARKSQVEAQFQQAESNQPAGAVVIVGASLARKEELLGDVQREIERIEGDKALLLGGKQALSGMQRQQQVDRAVRYEQVAQSLSDAGMADVSDRWRQAARQLRARADK